MTHSDAESAMHRDLDSLGMAGTVAPDVSARLRVGLMEHIENVALATRIADHVPVGDVEAMRLHLSTYIGTASEPASSQRDAVGREGWRGSWVRRVAAVAAATAIVVGFMSLLVRSADSPAQASLLEIARALSVVDNPPPLVEGVKYRVTTESRIDDILTDDQTAVVDIVHDVTVYRGPGGMTRADEEFVSAAAVVPSDHETQAVVDRVYNVGVVTSVTVTGDEPDLAFDVDGTVDEVRRDLGQLAVVSHRPDDLRAYAVVEEIRRAYLWLALTPAQRATMLTVVATTPGVEYTESSSGFTASVEGPGNFGFNFIYAFTFDPEGWLVETTVVTPRPWEPWLLEAGSIVSRSVISVPVPIS